MTVTQLIYTLSLAYLATASCVGERQEPADSVSLLRASLVVQCPPPTSYRTCYRFCDCSTGKVLCKIKYAEQNCVHAKPPCKCVESKTSTTSVKSLATDPPSTSADDVNFAATAENAAPFRLKCKVAMKFPLCNKACSCSAEGKLACKGEKATKDCTQGGLACSCVPNKATQNEDGEQSVIRQPEL